MKKRPHPPSVGMRDRIREGWCEDKTGQLTEGVIVRSTDTVIDVGCGYGGIIGFCAGQGARTLFIDVDAERLLATEKSIKASPAHAYQAIHSDCDPIPLDDEIGDIVICTEVLEHVSDPARLMDELVRIMKPGGKLVVSVPDERGEAFAAATAPDSYFKEPYHVRVFASGELESMIIGAGLAIDSEQYIGCFWSFYLPLSWLTAEEGDDVPVDNPHPITDHWTRLWRGVQSHPKGELMREALNKVLPRTHCFVASKPQHV
ncbi:MAG: class I SAM-dependent methyltransferase [Pseudomonadota bacterium]